MAGFIGGVRRDQTYFSLTGWLTGSQKITWPVSTVFLSMTPIGQRPASIPTPLRGLAVPDPVRPAAGAGG
ncbi:hypothetical protein, partial [Paracoccus sp. IB05]|uniref:hypothetical protein n=1 Tax=Paracoccus sp. IB05 TaxID=2779367 RepID=UPI001E361CAC